MELVDATGKNIDQQSTSLTKTKKNPDRALEKLRRQIAVMICTNLRANPRTLKWFSYIVPYQFFCIVVQT